MITDLFSGHSREGNESRKVVNGLNREGGSGLSREVMNFRYGLIRLAYLIQYLSKEETVLSDSENEVFSGLYKGVTGFFNRDTNGPSKEVSVLSSDVGLGRDEMREGASGLCSEVCLFTEFR